METETRNTTGNGDVISTEAPKQPTKQEILDQQRRDKRAAKLAEKEARKAANAAKRADGVIGTIRSMLEQPTGATRAEVLAKLTEKFPTRDPLGMAVTVGIQFSRLAKVGGNISNYKVEGRGRVYGFDKTLVRPAVVAEGTPEVPAAPAPVEVPAEPAPVEAGKGKGKGGKGK
jgi:hypothetical protein